MMRFVLLIVFVLVVEAVGGAIGTYFAPGDWYNALNKPFFTPPGAVFATAWPILYALVAFAGWRVFTAQGDIPGWGFWVAQLIFNFAWSPVFFGAEAIFWGMWIILAALSMSAAFIVTVWPRDRLSAICFLPYAAWLSFALLLNLSIWLLNGS